MLSLNKKGLTMIELIAVIAIIGIIIILVATNVFRTQASIQEGLFCTQVTAIEQAAIMWGNNNRSGLATICTNAGPGCAPTLVPLNGSRAQLLNAVPNNNNTRVSLQTLVNGGYLEGDGNNVVIDPRTNQSMNMNQTVRVFVRNNRVSAGFTYGYTEWNGPCH